jgi:hypothetical protein
MRLHHPDARVVEAADDHINLSAVRSPPISLPVDLAGSIS